MGLFDFIGAEGEDEPLVVGPIDTSIGQLGAALDPGTLSRRLFDLFFGLPGFLTAAREGGAFFSPELFDVEGRSRGFRIRTFNEPVDLTAVGEFFAAGLRGEGPAAGLQGDALFDALRVAFPGIGEGGGGIELDPAGNVVSQFGAPFAGAALPTEPFGLVDLAGAPASIQFFSRFAAPQQEVTTVPIHQELFPSIFGVDQAFEILDQPGGGFEVLGAEGGGGFLGDIFGDVVAGAGDILGDIARAAGRTGIALLEQELRDRFGVRPGGTIPGQAPPGQAIVGTGDIPEQVAGLGTDLAEAFFGLFGTGGGNGMPGTALGRSIFQSVAPTLFHVTPAGRITPNSLTLVADGQGGMSFFVNAGRPTHFSRIGKWPRSRRHHHHPR